MYFVMDGFVLQALLALQNAPHSWKTVALIFTEISVTIVLSFYLLLFSVNFFSFSETRFFRKEFNHLGF